jgi:murein DD-endopeptidase MepM/ murein hydrolase activator NlpD
MIKKERMTAKHRHKDLSVSIIRARILGPFIFLLLAACILTGQASPVYPDYRTPFIVPLEGEITVGFRQSYWDEEKEKEYKHTGIDIGGKYGQKVHAAGSGIVSYIGFSPIGGRTLVIKHNQKIRTTYLNLMDIYVSTGTYVKQGDMIASIGADDDPSSPGCHLHFGVIYDNKYLDPEDLLNIDYSNISRFIYLKYIPSDYEFKHGDNG